MISAPGAGVEKKGAVMNQLEQRLRLRCVGSGDAFGNGARLNSCYHLALGDQQLLLDCGCSSLIGLQRCGLKASEITTVVISHLHGDHFGGIPFLLLEGKYASRRRHPLALVGPVGLQRQVETVLNAFYPGVLESGFDFPVSYLTLKPQKMFTVGGFTLQAWPVKHGGSRHVYGLRVSVGGKTVSYSGDTEWTDTLIDLANDSDLLIVECCAYDQVIPSHLDYQTLLAKKAQLNCRRLVLTHMGPEMLARLEHLEIEALTDGSLLEL